MGDQDAKNATTPLEANLGLVHDYLLVMRGAERSFAAIASCFPSAPLYTLMLDREQTAPFFDGRSITTSYLQRLPVRQDGFRRLLPFFPRAVEHLPVQEHDVVLSSSSAFAHGVRPREGATHICYCYTPFRYVYDDREQALAETPRPLRPIMDRILERMERWDRQAAARVDHYIAISELSRERIARLYERDATVLHPPVEVERFTPSEPEDYFLVVSEIVRHKRVELALEAARLAGKRIKVVGSGPDLPRLEALYGHSAEFLGRRSDEELAELSSRALALIVPNVEEFGIAMVEAQAAGRPVVAADDGGAREIVVNGQTGELFPVGDVGALAESLRHTDFTHFDRVAIVANSARFSRDAFSVRLRAEVRRLTATG